jgi:hypothetical protein
MTEEEPSLERTRIFAQLQRSQERAIQVLLEAKSELDSPLSRTLLERLKSEGTTELYESVKQVVVKLEDAIRSAQYCQSEIHRELVSHRTDLEPTGIANLPPALARFLAERKDTPGFTYTVRQDLVRGWIVHWKEYTARGTVRGSGQLYERPFAWLDQ